jgi:putative membrane protein
MNAVALVLAVALGIVLIAVGFLEAFQYRNQRWFSMFRIRAQDADAVRLWVVNLGFYNIVYGLGAIAGVVLALSGAVAAGLAIVLFVCISHIVLAIVLIVVDRSLWRNSVYEAILPIAVLIALSFTA